MDWKGIEWIVPIYEIVVLVVPIYGFIVLRRHVKQRILSKARGLLYYSGIVISPVVIYAVFMFVLMGLEEIADTAIIPEEMGRVFLLLVGMGIIVWLVSITVFGIAIAFIRGSAGADD